ncbi:MAG: protein kinase [Deltaproteobacteria bacterium]|nr:protein kinase [Deltaproteobacteria bacterium]
MLSAPDRIGDYTLLGEIGRGGMGVVFRARDERTGAQVALKMLPPETADKGDSALRFKREFRAIQRVVHPNVVRVFEAGTYRGAPYFTMELVEGKELRRWLDGDEPIVKLGKDPPPADTLPDALRKRLNEPGRVRRLAEAIVQVGFALGAIHAHRIVHRDLKPDNILVTNSGVVKLMDFGIAKQFGGPNTGDTSSGGMVVGTFKYLSPEQALGIDLDGRADLYCLGVILYELLAGRHPFFSETSVGYAYHHARTIPPPITRFNPEVNPGLRAVAEKLLHKETEKRFPTSDDVISALKDAVKGIDEHIKKLQQTSAGLAPPPFQMSKDPLFAPGMVGRQSEFQALRTALEKTAQGQGHVVALSGVTGSGKSRLIKEVAATLKEQGLELVWGAAGKNASQPFAVFGQLFESLVREWGSRSPQEVESILGADGPALVRHLPALHRLPASLRPKPLPALGPDDELVRFRAALLDVLGRMARVRPRVLVLEDVHAADEASMDVIQQVATRLVMGERGRGEKLGLVVTVDPAMVEPDSPAARMISELGALQRAKVITLKALSPGEAAQMLRAMVGGEDVATALGEALYKETRGIPFLVEERIRAWADRGDLVRAGKKWALRAGKGRGFVDLDHATSNDVPVSMTGEGEPIEDRLASVSAAARDVAERASVLEGRLHGEVLMRVVLRPEEEVLDAIDELIKRKILVEGQDDGYAFASEEMRVAVSETLDPERRARFHLLMAHSLEDFGRRSARGAEPETLARHYKLGGEPLRAFDYLAQSTRRALDVNATRAAMRYVQEAEQVLDVQGAQRSHDPAMSRRSLEILLLRLETLSTLGNMKEVEKVCHERLPALADKAEPRLYAEARFHEANALTLLGNTDQALQIITSVLSVTERGGAHRLRCKAKRLCGTIYDRRGQPDRGLRYNMEALELARAIGEEQEEQAARMAIAARRLETGNLEAARRDFTQVLAHAQMRGERLRACQCMNLLGQASHEIGDFSEADTAYRKARELALAVGHRRMVATTTLNLAILARDEGRLDEALKGAEEARKAFDGSGAVDAVAFADTVIATAHLAAERNEAALEAARKACRASEQLALAATEAEARLCRGLASVRLGRVQEGLADIEAGLARARAYEANRITLAGLWYLGLARLHAGDEAGAMAALEEGVARAERTGYRRYGSLLEGSLQRLGPAAVGG